MRKNFFMIGLASCLLFGPVAQASALSIPTVTLELDKKPTNELTLEELIELLGSTEVDRNRTLPVASMFVCGVSTEYDVCLQSLMNCSGVTLSVYNSEGLMIGSTSGNLTSGQWLTIPVKGLSGNFEVLVSLPDGTVLTGTFHL